MGKEAKGSPWPVSNSALARILINIAPTPMGPKCPQNKASRQDSKSGMKGERASRIGIRRNKRIKMAMTTSLHGTMVSRGEFIELHGMMLP